MKLINSEGRVTVLPRHGITIDDKTPVEVKDELAEVILAQEKTVKIYETKDKKGVK